MRLHFVVIPIHGGDAVEEQLNHFLTSQRIAAVDRQFVPNGVHSAWAICVTYVDGVAAAPGTADPSKKKGTVDYREVLHDAEFLVFAKLRDLRKQLAQRDGVPAWAVFTNEQLAAMVRGGGPRSAAELGKIEGIGPAKMEKYVGPFLEIINAPAPTPPADGTPKDAPA